MMCVAVLCGCVVRRWTVETALECLRHEAHREMPDQIRPPACGLLGPADAQVAHLLRYIYIPDLGSLPVALLLRQQVT